MRVLLIYPPLRGQPDHFLPLGCLTIAAALQEMGVDVQILNVDVERLSDKDIVKRVRAYDPMIIGYSAVTSTTYTFIKRITKVISENVNKKIYFIVGGNITASSDILIERCGVDTCFIGEGYLSIKEYVGAYDDVNRMVDYEKLLSVTGLVFKYDGKIIFTGRRKLLSLDEIPLPKNLDFVDTTFYFPLVKEIPTLHYSDDIQKRILSLPEGSRYADVMIGSGCQNSCSFCHRNVHGMRQRSISIVFDYVDYLIDHFDVRMFSFGDESLFVREDWIRSFEDEISKRNVIFGITGIRADMVVKYKDILNRLFKVGLVHAEVGLESGSQKMLNIMDKNITVEDNYKAIEIINSLGIYHVPQIIFGMPGENLKSVKETAKMVQKCRSSRGFVSMNVAQVLPGTPLYWFALKRGFINDEEDYLIRISGRNASQTEGTVNVTEYPLSIFELVRDKIAARSLLCYGNIAMGLRFFAHYWWILIKRVIGRGSLSLKEKLALTIYALLGVTFKIRKYDLAVGSLRKLMNQEDGEVIRADPIKCIKYGVLPPEPEAF